MDISGGAGHYSLSLIHIFFLEYGKYEEQGTNKTERNLKYDIKKCVEKKTSPPPKKEP